MSGLDFAADGTVKIHALEIDGESVPRPRVTAGRWRLRGTTVILESPGAKPATGALTPEGALELKGLDRFTDDPDDCSA